MTGSFPRDDLRATRIAAWSAIGGLLTALAVTALSGRLPPDHQAGGATTFGALGFAAAVMAPFAASLLVFLTPSVELRRAIWLASGVLALGLAALTLLSGIGFLFGAAAVGLIWAWRLTREPAGRRDRALALAPSGWLFLWLGGALVALWLRETPLCWSASANGAGWAAAATSVACRSDIVDDTEGLLALGGVATGLAGMAGFVRGGRRRGNVAATA